MKKHLLIFITATALAGISSLSAHAKDFTVGVEDIDYYPIYRAKSGEYSGYSADLLTSFAESKGYRFIYKPFPLNRLFQAFVKGEVDFKYPDDPHWQSDVKKGVHITYSKPVVHYIDGINVRPEFKGKKAEDIQVVGTVSGFTVWALIDAVKSGKVKVIHNLNFQALIKNTVAKRIDYTYANVDVIKYNLKQMGMPNALVYDPGLPQSEGDYYLSSVKHPEIIEEFNQWMKENTTTVAALRKKYDIQ